MTTIYALKNLDGSRLNNITFFYKIDFSNFNKLLLTHVIFILQ